MKRISNIDKNKEKAKIHKEMLLNKKIDKINKMSDNEIINELKRKNLPVYGTRIERIERLKKKEGIIDLNNSKAPKENVLNNIEKIKNKREERRAVYEKKV